VIRRPSKAAHTCLRLGCVRLAARAEGLFDRNHNHRRGLLAVDSKTLLPERRQSRS
jgi:hypothetical protein